MDYTDGFTGESLAGYIELWCYQGKRGPLRGVSAINPENRPYTLSVAQLASS